MSIVKFSGQSATMSSREIADLIEKQHSNIKISAERLSAAGVIGTLATQEFTHNGNVYTEYLLCKRDSLILVAQNCPEFTARIVDRWQELEATQAHAIPKTMAQALRLAADQAEQIEAQQLLIEQQQPAVEFVDRFVEAKSAKGFREVAKILGVKERDFIADLAEGQVIFKQGSNWLPMAHHQHAGRFTVKTGEANGHAFVQTRFTPEGIAWVAKRYSKAGPCKTTATHAQIALDATTSIAH
jgi:phage antirepressor YoqD-like protein